MRLGPGLRARDIGVGWVPAQICSAHNSCSCFELASGYRDVLSNTSTLRIPRDGRGAYLYGIRYMDRDPGTVWNQKRQGQLALRCLTAVKASSMVSWP